MVDKVFQLQLGTHSDILSADRLKPAFSANPILAALPPAHGHPTLGAWILLSTLVCCVIRPCVMCDPPSAAVPAWVPPRNNFMFELTPSCSVWGNPRQAVQDKGTAPPLFCHSFWGEYCGGLMFAQLFQTENLSFLSPHQLIDIYDFLYLSYYLLVYLKVKYS